MKLYCLDTRFNKVIACIFEELVFEYDNGSTPIFDKFSVRFADGAVLHKRGHNDEENPIEYINFNPNPQRGNCFFKLSFYEDKECTKMVFYTYLYPSRSGYLCRHSVSECGPLVNEKIKEITKTNNLYVIKNSVVTKFKRRESMGQVFFDIANDSVEYNTKFALGCLPKVFYTKEDAEEYLQSQRKFVDFEEETEKRKTLKEIEETERKMEELQKQLSKLRGAL